MVPSRWSRGGGRPRVLRTAAWLRLVAGVGRYEGVRAPLPDVPGHVVEAVSVGWETVDRRRARVAIDKEVLPGELTLPRICHRPAPRGGIVAPAEDGTLEPP